MLEILYDLYNINYMRAEYDGDEEIYRWNETLNSIHMAEQAVEFSSGPQDGRGLFSFFIRFATYIISI